MKTYSAKPADVTRKWYLIDASEAPFGRISTEVATLLTGKHKPMYTPHIDCGDYVVIINADKLVATGDKLNKKIYYRHTGYPGGLKERTLEKQLEKDSTEAILHSVRGMLPINKLRDGRLARLKIYRDENHAHAAQAPENYSVKKGKK